MRKCAAVLCFAIAVNHPVEAGPITVAAFGDSLVHGYGLKPSEGFVPQLNVWLQGAGSNAKVMNAGVSGDTSAGGLMRVDWTLESKPDAFIVVLGGNDLLRGLQPEDSRNNLEGIVSKIASAGLPVLLVGQEAPENYGLNYKEQFEAIYVDLADQFGILLYPRYFDALIRKVGRSEARQKFMQDDGLHPNAAGVTLIVEDIGPLVLELIGQAAKSAG